MLARFLLLLVLFSSQSWAQTPAPPASDLPYYQEIHKLLDAVEYSGLEVLTKPDVGLKVDFNKRSWTLTNIHKYDVQGNILLEAGKYGLCAELSTYLYQKIGPILSDRYNLKFAMATEAGFFPSYQSNHIVLLIRDRTSENGYLIDPSFHKYGHIKDLPEYQVLGLQDELSFVKDQSPDVSFLVDQAMPFFIKDYLLLSFSVISVDGKFDKNNFLFVVTANRRSKKENLNLLMAGKYHGQIESFEAKGVLEQFLSANEAKSLHRKLNYWLLQNIS